MKIKINDNVFDVISRLKQINNSFYVVYNLSTKKFELHSSNYGSLSYILTFPYNSLDGRVINYTLKNIYQNDNSIEKIDKHNEKIKLKMLEKVKSENEYKTTKLLDYSNKKSNDPLNVFKSVWM